MPSVYTENAQRWLELSEIDYLGNFVKAWLAFNAWYRGVYTHNTDRMIIDEVKWQPNTIRSKLVPLLNSNTEDGEQLRSEIGSLHQRIENFHLYTGKGLERERISLKQVYLKSNPTTRSGGPQRRMVYDVSRSGTNGQVISTIVNSQGQLILSITQPKYDLSALEADAKFVGLTSTQKGFLTAAYRDVCPRLICDLTNRRGAPIQLGSFHFFCTPEDLFAGVCEVVYLMRCMLFHGELVPSRDASACYEPAYHIVRRFLVSIS